MHEIIKSVGIDIGTSTTQLIFSELTIENEASNYVVPRINIVDKKVTYRSKIYFTPLLDQKTIDAEKVKEIIEKEYQDAGMKPEDLSTGAVIITGETARKQNANVVLDTLSNLAGDLSLQRQDRIWNLFSQREVQVQISCQRNTEKLWQIWTLAEAPATLPYSRMEF